MAEITNCPPNPLPFPPGHKAGLRPQSPLKKAAAVLQGLANGAAGGGAMHPSKSGPQNRQLNPALSLPRSAGRMVMPTVKMAVLRHPGALHDCVEHGRPVQLFDVYKHEKQTFYCAEPLRPGGLPVTVVHTVLN